MVTCRYLCDGPASGAWNMAVDEALLESAAERGVATLRFYGWSEPTLSLGYFQPLGDREAHPASRNCPVVRRSSGGGAILHDRELTYSLAVPRPSNSLPRQSLSGPRSAAGTRSSTWLYAAVHDALVTVLAATGITAHRALEGTKPSSGPQPFLCFERRAEHDVLLDSAEFAGAKIAGSAQRRHRDATLQHGSLLLARSPLAPELPGIQDLRDVSATPEAIQQAWASAIEGRIEHPLQSAQLLQSEIDRAREILQVRYGNAAWTHRR